MHVVEFYMWWIVLMQSDYGWFCSFLFPLFLALSWSNDIFAQEKQAEERREADAMNGYPLAIKHGNWEFHF